MKINEIGNNPCKLGKTTISVYNPNTGKLCGMIKGIQRCGADEMSLRQRFDLRQKYHWDLSIEKKCILIDGTAYYILNDRNMRFYEDLLRDKPEAYGGMFEEEHRRKLNEIETAKHCGVEVLRLNLM